jgi:hypothetical protein
MRKGRGAGRDERLQIMLSPDELEVVDTFRFDHRMPSRAAAVRELFRLGLTVIGTREGEAGVKSSHYGVLSTGPNSSRRSAASTIDGSKRD